jgi:hypothetical protein
VYGEIAERVMKSLKKEMSTEGVAPILIKWVLLTWLPSDRLLY